MSKELNNIEAANTNNVNTASFDFTIDEIEIKGISLKGLKMSARADFSDEKVRTEVDGCVSIFKMLLNWGDEKVNKLIDDELTDRREMRNLRKKEKEAHIAESLSRVERDKAEAVECEARAERQRKESEKLDLEIEELRNRNRPETADSDK